MRPIDADALETDLSRQYDQVFGKARKSVNPDDFYIERYSSYHANVVDAELNGFFAYLKTRPTVDAVPVVRCGDCKYGRCLNQSEAEIYCEEYLICKNSDATMAGYNVVPQQHFCSYGERRADNAID